MDRAGVRAVQSTPLISTSGALVGILSTHFAVPSRPTEQQMLAMRNASQLVANAIIRVRARTTINHIENSTRLVGESQQALATAEKILSRTC
jgi:GAF domain-containing protein